MDQSPLAMIWEKLSKTWPGQLSQGYLQAFSQPPVPVTPRPVRPINPALLDNGLHPYDPKEGGVRFDRFREDEPGVQEWVRRYGSSMDQGEGTAPAIPPNILLDGASADPRGELPNPMWLKEYMRAKGLDITRI